MLAGARDRRELKNLQELHSRFRRIKPAAEDFDHCLALIARHTLRHGAGWPDCLIAATALRLRTAVATTNDKHFRVFKGLKVHRPY